MSCDYKAKAVIGIRIDPNDIPVKTVVEKAFKHSYSPGMRFDPQTGKKLWVEKDIPLIAFHEEYEGDLDEKTTLVEIDGVEAFESGSSDDYEIILGYGVDDTGSNGGNYYDFAKLPNTETLKKDLKKALEPYNLWDEKKFGLYAVLYCGC